MRTGFRSERLLACIAGMAFQFALPHSCFADPSDLLSIVRAGHRAARESIHTISATVTNEVTYSKKPGLKLAGKYWRTLDTVRIQEKEGFGPGTADYLLKGSEIHQVGRGEGKRPGEVHYNASRRARGDILCVLDVWRLLMIDFIGPNGGSYNLDRFLDFAVTTPQARREKKDGHDCIRVSLTIVSTEDRESSITLWHDVDRNYLVWKERRTGKGSSDTVETEIMEFSEPVPGVIIPMKCRLQLIRNGESVKTEDIVLSDIQVNRPIPASVFQLPTIPRGTILTDDIQRTSYPIDELWRPIGPSKPYQRLTGPGRSEGAESNYRSQSTSEAVPLHRSLIPASLALLIGIFAYLLYRQYRLRGQLRARN